MFKASGTKIDPSGIGRIMIRATNWIGDAVMTLPALEAVKRSFPDSTLTVVARPWVAPLFEDHPLVDDVIVYNKGTGLLDNMLQMLNTIKQIRKRKFDLALYFQNAFEAALLGFLGGCRLRAGYRTDGRGLLMTHGIVRDQEILSVHQVEYYLAILKAFGWESESCDPRLYLDNRSLERADELLQANNISDTDFVLGLGPGAMYGNAKRWPPERFARIGDWAAKRWNAKVLVFGSGKEMDIADVVCRNMNHDSLNLCGRTSLKEAMGLISRCNFFVTNDSGLMHISSALGLPTLAIFGSTDHVATGPRGARTRIIRHDTECAPCLRPECPGDHHCMLSIEPEEVWNEMEDFRKVIV